MKKMKWDVKLIFAVMFAVLFCLSLSVNAAQSAETRRLRTRLSMERQRDMTDVVDAMADIEVNLQKLLIASGAGQSAELLGETALLAQHVQSGLSRLPLSHEASSGAMKFAGQMGDYAMTLAAQVSSGRVLTIGDEHQIEGLLTACQGLNEHLTAVGEQIYSQPMEELESGLDAAGTWPETAIAGDGAIEYPSLIYDGPFSDGRQDGAPKGLTGERITREQARALAARYAGAALEQVRDAADSGGRFEAFGFAADTPEGAVSVQVTGHGGHLLWMMPENAEYETKLDEAACLEAAKAYLTEMGFGEMEACFVQAYDGMLVANFAGVQQGVLLYPDQVKLQVSRATGRVVGAECSQYLTNHTLREALTPTLTQEQAQQTLSSRLQVRSARLCIIPTDGGEQLCWEFRGLFSGAQYYAYVDAHSGETADILRVAQTEAGETAI